MKEQKFVDLSDEQLERVSGGREVHPRSAEISIFSVSLPRR